MKKLSILLCLSLPLLTLLSCKKNELRTPFTVQAVAADGSGIAGVQWTLIPKANHRDEGALIHATANQRGEAVFRVDAAKGYVLYLASYGEHGSLSSIQGATHLQAGTFSSQQDIDNHALQTPAAAIGGPKYVDLNSDGLVNASDLVIPVDVRRSEPFIVQLSR